MEKKLNVFDYLTQVFTIFGILILILNIFCLLFGESAKEYSTIFSLGDTGLSITTMLQFLFAIAIITAIKFLFMTDYIIKSLSMTIRIILLFTFSFCNVLVFIFLCKWFPVNDLKAWIMFIICFTVSCLISTLISNFKENYENRRLEEALQKSKEKVYGKHNNMQ